MSSMDELVKWFQLNYPQLVREMQQSNHHLDESNLNPYHIEGDVWTHTMMVCLMARSYPRAVQMAALLHDIGKPHCRGINRNGDRTTFYSHDSVSAFLSLEVTRKYGMTPAEQAMVFQLIAMHTDPFRLSSDQLARKLRGASLKFIEQFRRLVTADTNGRFYTEGDKRDYGSITADTLDAPAGQPLNCTFLIGPPCSGKSTWVDRAIIGTDTVILSRDAILMDYVAAGESYNDAFKRIGHLEEIDREFNSILRNAIKDGQNLIIDRTNMTKKGRNRIISKLNRNYSRKAVVFLTDCDTLYERNESRVGKSIPSDVMERMITSFSIPTYEQFDQIDYLIDGQLVPAFGRTTNE